LTDIEKKSFDCLNKEPIHIEEIINKTDIPAGKVNAALVSMRLKGIVKQLPGDYFLKKI
jgi:DNA processing protein